MSATLEDIYMISKFPVSYINLFKFNLVGGLDRMNSSMADEELLGSVDDNLDGLCKNKFSTR
jgi:hypothetical protein